MFILSIVVAALLAGHAAATGVHFAAETPTLAAKTLHANEYIYFPQTLQRVTFLVNDTLLMSYQSGADQLHDDGWRGGLLGSTDQGVTWNIVEQPHSPLLVKSCYEPGKYHPNINVFIKKKRYAKICCAPHPCPLGRVHRVC